MPLAIILMGPSGSGKSTWLNAQQGNLICSADHHFYKNGEYQFNPAELPVAHAACRLKFLEALAAKQPRIAVDNTNTTPWELAFYVEAATAHGYEVELKLFDVLPERCKSMHGCPDHAVKRQHLQLNDLLRPGGMPPWYPQPDIIREVK